MNFTPRPYQSLLAEHIHAHPRCAVWAGMGMGKTAGALYALDILRLVEDSPALILAPLRVAEGVWPLETLKWGGFHKYHIVPIIGTAQARLRALRKPADAHAINYENLPWLLEQVGDRWPWTTVIADEATRLKSFRLGGSTGRRAKALGAVAFTKVKRFVELTGTPSPNGLIDLWGQLWFLDKGERLGRTYTAFLRRWFRQVHPMSYYQVEPLQCAEREITERVKDLCLSIRAQDYFDLRDPIVVDVPVMLPTKAHRLYKEMEKRMFIELANGGEASAANAAAKTLKCLQLANGAVYTDEKGAWENVHDAKLDALESILAEASGAPVLVAYHFKTDLIRLKKRFPQGRELDKSPKTIRDWNDGKIPVLFAHPASAGHGLNLQDGGNIVVMFGHWWDLEQYQQIIERIGPVRQLQAGYDRPVYIYNIRAVGTVDNLVISRRTDKRKVQDLLLEAARRGITC